MTGFTSLSVAIVISPRVTSHLTFVSLKTGKGTEQHKNIFVQMQPQYTLMASVSKTVLIPVESKRTAPDLFNEVADVRVEVS